MNYCKSIECIDREEFELFYSKELGRSRYSYAFERCGEGYLVGHTQRAWLEWCGVIST